MIAEDVIEANGRSIEQQLGGLRFFDMRRNCPTYAGILMFGNRPVQFMPGAYVQFLRLAGTTPTSEVIDDKQITGDLVTVLQTLDLLIDVNIRSRPVFISGLREETRHDYPRLAVRELLLNAVMHRNYQSNTPIRFYWFTDRIEISNPGGLYGEAATGIFPERNDYRNPVIAEAMRALGYVNRYGQGVMRAQKALRENGNPPADIRPQTDWFDVTIHGLSTADRTSQLSEAPT